MKTQLIRLLLKIRAFVLVYSFLCTLTPIIILLISPFVFWMGSATFHLNSWLLFISFAKTCSILKSGFPRTGYNPRWAKCPDLTVACRKVPVLRNSWAARMGVKTFLVFIYSVLFCVTDYETLSIVGVWSSFFPLSPSEQENVKLHSAPK